MAKKEVVMSVKKSDLPKILTEYNELSKQIKVLDERKKALGDTLKNYAMNNGSKDDKGSYYCEESNFTFGAQCKKSVSLDEESAKKFIQKRGFEDCLKTIIKVDETALETHVANGDISPEELESFTNIKTTYAITVKVNEEMPEVQQTTVAASKKPVLKLPRKR